MKQCKYITVLHIEEHADDGQWPPENIIKFSQWVHDVIASIPKNCRKNALINISSMPTWEGCSEASIKVTYTRQETNQERSERLDQEAAQEVDHEKQILINELSTLAYLKAKYEPKR